MSDGSTVAFINDLRSAFPDEETDGHDQKARKSGAKFVD
ncbi:hypothetical protein RvY_07100 [Ramazzottius varieornatus]|uniref:Uncharacterized protein n=1 Tax=Ramazzottius varieornatus TaxID=947166 RepID=A0A1D1V0W7_RAMVA|nr:hypothetical protein RvY_07100 [Ramazzottius varieornatus]